MFAHLKLIIKKLIGICELLYSTNKSLVETIIAYDAIINLMFFAIVASFAILLFAFRLPDIMEYYQDKKLKKRQNGEN